ncbi:MAG: hypothetical protein PF487_00060, partial [Bacteroidales bacterium]|nr:hypothetical protein [Bacteroidales bacterium]
MKKTLLMSIALLTIVFSYNPIFAQKKRKVLESRKRNAPKWVNGLEENYIIVMGSANNIEQAKQNALKNIKERIVTSIAENVQTQSSYKQVENTTNNISNYYANFETKTETQSADIAYIKGISLNNAEDYYWEKVRESNGAIKYYYHLKYPFKKSRLEKLVYEFEKADRELTDQLNAIINNIDNISTIEDIIKSIKKLENLSKSFLDQRKNTADLGIIQLKSKLKSISSVPIKNDLGHVIYTLK